MLGAIKYNLANLTNFSGRDARQTFWYYVLFLVIIQMVVSIAISVPMMGSAFTGAIEAAQSGVSEEAMQARMMNEMSGWFEVTIWISLAMGLVMILLLAAAFVRRIHDSDHSGWWAALAVGAQLVSAGYTVTMVGKMRELMALSMNPANLDEVLARQGEFMGIGLIGYIPVIVVVVFGVMKSTDGPNRFGGAPVRF